jgi:hypothetical protein
MNRSIRTIVREVFRALLVVAAVTAVGCAGPSKYAKFQPLPRGTNVHVIAIDPELAVPNAKTAGETVGKEAAKGAGMGLAGGISGGLYLSMLCGPAIIVCAPVLVPAGAAVGVVGGTAMGAGQASVKALSKEKAEALERVMSAVLHDASFSDAMHSAFVEHSKGRWNLTNDSNAVRVMLGLEALSLTQLEDDVVALNLTASMLIMYGPGDGQKTRRFLFNIVTSGRPVNDFLDNDGALFQEQLSTALQTSVDEIIAALDYANTRYETQ